MTSTGTPVGGRRRAGDSPPLAAFGAIGGSIGRRGQGGRPGAHELRAQKNLTNPAKKFPSVLLIRFYSFL